MTSLAVTAALRHVRAAQAERDPIARQRHADMAIAQLRDVRSPFAIAAREAIAAGLLQGAELHLEVEAERAERAA